MNDDTPLTLQEACDLIFRGNIKPATLRAEAQRGRLVIERIGRKDFVTPAAIKRMREMCQVTPSPPANTQGHWTTEQRSQAATAAALRVSADLKKMGQQ